MADAFDQFEALLRENIEAGVIDLQLEDEDPSWALLDTFQPTEVGGRTADGNAGYEASWRVRVQRAGRVTGAPMTGNTVSRMGPDNVNYMGQSADALYLDPALTPQRSYIKLKMLLTRMKGSITVNRQQILADMASTPIEEVAFDHVEDSIWQVRHLWTSLFYSQGNGVLALVNGAGQTVGEGAARAWITIDGGSPFRFAEGQRVYAATIVAGKPTVGRQGDGVPTDPASIMYVIDVDADNRKVLLESAPAEGTVTLTDNDGLVVDGMYSIADTANYAFNSVEQLLIATGDYPGTGYAVTDHSKLKSFIEDNTAAMIDPTPENIAKMTDKMVTAGKRPPSVLLAEESVWSYYSQLEREGHVSYDVPQGANFVASGGISGPVIKHGTHMYRTMSSSKIRESSIIGIAPETFKRFMPLGTKTLRWVMNQGGVAGVGSIFRPVTSGRSLTELSDAPYECYSQLGQTDPRRCFRILGVHSQRSAEAA